MRRFRRILLSLLAVSAAACFDDPFAYGTRGGAGAVPDEIGFEGDVYPILLSYCSACHSEGAAAGGTAFVLTNDAGADYPMVGALVSPGDPANSRLLQKGSGAVSHGGGAVLSESSIDYRILASWIEQGAAQ